jgi:hypothetical protein
LGTWEVLLGLLEVGQERHMTMVRLTEGSGMLIEVVELRFYTGDPVGEENKMKLIWGKGDI